MTKNELIALLVLAVEFGVALGLAAALFLRVWLR